MHLQIGNGSGVGNKPGLSWVVFLYPGMYILGYALVGMSLLGIWGF